MNATMYANANDGYVRSGPASYATAGSDEIERRLSEDTA